MSECERVREFCKTVNEKYGYAVSVHYNTLQALKDGADAIEKQAHTALALVIDMRAFADRETRADLDVLKKVVREVVRELNRQEQKPHDFQI